MKSKYTLFLMILAILISVGVSYIIMDLRPTYINNTTTAFYVQKAEIMADEKGKFILKAVNGVRQLDVFTLDDISVEERW